MRARYDFALPHARATRVPAAHARDMRYLTLRQRVTADVDKFPEFAREMK